MRCAIWYHLYHLKNVKNTHGGVLLLAPKVIRSFMGVCQMLCLTDTHEGAYVTNIMADSQV